MKDDNNVKTTVYKSSDVILQETQTLRIQKQQWSQQRKLATFEAVLGNMYKRYVSGVISEANPSYAIFDHISFISGYGVAYDVCTRSLTEFDAYVKDKLTDTDLVIFYGFVMKQHADNMFFVLTSKSQLFEVKQKVYAEYKNIRTKVFVADDFKDVVAFKDKKCNTTTTLTDVSETTQMFLLISLVIVALLSVGYFVSCLS